MLRIKTLENILIFRNYFKLLTYLFSTLFSYKIGLSNFTWLVFYFYILDEVRIFLSFCAMQLYYFICYKLLGLKIFIGVTNFKCRLVWVVSMSQYILDVHHLPCAKTIPYNTTNGRNGKEKSMKTNFVLLHILYKCKKKLPQNTMSFRRVVSREYRLNSSCSVIRENTSNDFNFKRHEM